MTFDPFLYILNFLYYNNKERECYVITKTTGSIIENLPESTEEFNQLLTDGKVLMKDREGQLINGIPVETEDDESLYCLYVNGECVNTVNDQYIYVCGYHIPD